jgi:signal transduction histidine kinase
MQDDHAHRLAPSGIAALPSLSWGSHIGQLFSSADDLRDLLVPYFQAGLANHEHCLWVTDAPFAADDARDALRAVVPDLALREQRGQIDIQNSGAFYDPDQPLKPRELVAGLMQRERDALAAGYRGLRTHGNCAWVDHAHWDDFLDYESSVQEAVRGRRMICMCGYRHEQIEPGGVVDVLDRHHLLLRGQPANRATRRRPDREVTRASSRTIIGGARLDFHEDIDAVQAIAALGHDLRNPIAAISAGATLLRRSGLGDKERAISEAIGRSANHMAALVDDIADMARGVLGNGIALRLTHDGLEPALRHTIEELRLAYPGRAIETAISLPNPVEVDPLYVARLLSNLLKNALIYGSQTDPVKVEIASDDGFTVSVSNTGPQIPAEIHEGLFEPFTRGPAQTDQQGLGLGLFIVAEIARAHGGTIDVVSTADETRFTFRMPLKVSG